MDKNSKPSKVKQIKAEIIVHVLDFIDEGKAQEKLQAIEKLKEYAKFYSISLYRKDCTPNIKLHLRQFVLNKEGYIITVKNLFNSLNYAKK